MMVLDKVGSESNDNDDDRNRDVGMDDGDSYSWWSERRVGDSGIDRSDDSDDRVACIDTDSNGNECNDYCSIGVRW